MERVCFMKGWAIRAACGLAIAGALAAAVTARAQTSVVYPSPETPADARYDDLIETLKVALEKTRDKYGPYTLAPAGVVMNESRKMASLREGSYINVTWSATTREKEEMFLPVRIPLRKGLLGYRILLINGDKQDALDAVRTAEDLKRFVAGQGLGWSDVAVWEAAGLNVMTANYENLFAMLANGRFDIFPRGVNEVFTEYEIQRSALPNIAVEKNLLIYYPWPHYFFFNKKDKALAERVEAGLKIMLEDGSFDAITMKYHGQAIARAGMKNRRLIRLENPLLPESTPLHDPRLWFTP